MTFIEIKNLDKTFFPGTNREQYALKNVNLDIKDGDFVTILGGNGAGKSTFLNALAGSFSLDNGEILIEGRDISNIDDCGKRGQCGSACGRLSPCDGKDAARLSPKQRARQHCQPPALPAARGGLRNSLHLCHRLARRA